MMVAVTSTGLYAVICTSL